MHYLRRLHRYVNIRQLSIDSRFEVNGITFYGLEDLQARVEAIYLLPFNSLITLPCQQIGGKFHIGLIKERYPCFDSEDYINETRYYQNFIFRKHTITGNDFAKTLRLCPRQTNCCLVTQQMPERMAPMLYYGGEGTQMFLVE